MANFSVMADVPNPLVDSNGNPFSGAVLKAFLPGGTTSTSIAIDSDGSSPQASITYNAQGKLEVTGNEILPYIDRKHKWGIFANAAAAAANTPFYMGPFDNVFPNIDSNSAIVGNFDTLTLAIADTKLSVDDRFSFTERTTGNGGGGTAHMVLTSSVTPNTDDIIISTGDALLSIVVELGAIVHTDQFGLVPDWDGATGTDNTARYQRLLIRAQDGEFNHIRFPGPSTRDYYFKPVTAKTTCCFLKQDVNDWQTNPNPIVIDGDAKISIDNASAKNVWMSGPDDDDGATPIVVVNDVNIEGNLTITSAVGTAGFDDPKTTMPNFGIAFNVGRWWRSSIKFNAYYIKGLVQSPISVGPYDSGNTFVQQLNIHDCHSSHAQENFIEFSQGFAMNILNNTIERGNGGIDMQRSADQSFFKTTVSGNIIQGNAKTNAFKCNFGVAFNFTGNYFESNRGTAGEALEQVKMSPNAILDLNSLVFEGNFFSMNVASLDLFGGPYNHVELDGFNNFFPKGNNFTGGNGYNMTNSTGLLFSEGETYTPLGSVHSEGAITIPSSTIEGVEVTGKVFKDTDDVNRVDAAKMHDGKDAFMTMQSEVITDGTAFTFRKIDRGITILTARHAINTNAIFVTEDAGVAPIPIGVTPSTSIDFSTTPSVPAANRVDVSVNAAGTGLVVYNNLGDDIKFCIWNVGASDWESV